MCYSTKYFICCDWFQLVISSWARITVLGTLDKGFDCSNAQQEKSTPNWLAGSDLLILWKYNSNSCGETPRMAQMGEIGIRSSVGSITSHPWAPWYLIKYLTMGVWNCIHGRTQRLWPVPFTHSTTAWPFTNGLARRADQGLWCSVPY